MSRSKKTAAEDLIAEVARQDRAAKRRSLEEHREWAVEILEEVIDGSLLEARAGNPVAAKSVITAVAAHAKILGYEAPKQLQHSGQVGGIVMHVSERVARAFEAPTARAESADAETGDTETGDTHH